MLCSQGTFDWISERMECSILFSLSDPSFTGMGMIKNLGNVTVMQKDLPHLLVEIVGYSERICHIHLLEGRLHEREYGECEEPRCTVQKVFDS